MPPFPYKERAWQAEAARKELHVVSAWRRTAAGKPSDKELRERVTQFHDQWAAAFPPEFWDDFERLRRGDAIAVDPAIEFLDADPWFFRSGYIKEELLDMLKRAPLTRVQMDRLRTLILRIVRTRYGRELRQFCRLARRLDDLKFRTELQALAAFNPLDPEHHVARRARWVLAALDGRDWRWATSR
jgi:hypothetical protein